jgi:hypothetical protein
MSGALDGLVQGRRPRRSSHRQAQERAIGGADDNILHGIPRVGSAERDAPRRKQSRVTTAPGRTRFTCGDTASRDAYHRPEFECTDGQRFSALQLIIVLQLIFGASRECVSAEQSRPAAGETDSVEVTQNEQEPALERSDRHFLPFAGQRVRKIRVTNLDVFGPSVDDTTRLAESRLERFLNHLNFRTRETTIRRTSSSGRGTPSILPAGRQRAHPPESACLSGSPIVVQAPESADSADVLVIVKKHGPRALRKPERGKTARWSRTSSGWDMQVSVTAG